MTVVPKKTVSTMYQQQLMHPAIQPKMEQHVDSWSNTLPAESTQLPDAARHNKYYNNLHYYKHYYAYTYYTNTAETGAHEWSYFAKADSPTLN